MIISSGLLYRDTDLISLQIPAGRIAIVTISPGNYTGNLNFLADSGAGFAAVTLQQPNGNSGTGVSAGTGGFWFLTLPPATGDVLLAVQAAGNFAGKAYVSIRILENESLDLTLLPSATRTVITQTPDFDVPQGGTASLFVTVNITAASGTGGLIPHLLSKDQTSGSYNDWIDIGTAKTAIGTYGYLITPHTGAVNGSGGSACMPLARTMALKMVPGDSTNYTYSVGVSVSVGG